MKKARRSRLKKKRIQDEANAKRAEAARVQHEVSNPRKGEVMVVGHSVQLPKKEAKDRTAKSKAAKVNPGAVARGDKRVKKILDVE